MSTQRKQRMEPAWTCGMTAQRISRIDMSHMLLLISPDIHISDTYRVDIPISRTLFLTGLASMSGNRNRCSFFRYFKCVVLLFCDCSRFDCILTHLHCKCKSFSFTAFRLFRLPCYIVPIPTYFCLFRLVSPSLSIRSDEKRGGNARLSFGSATTTPYSNQSNTQTRIQANSLQRYPPKHPLSEY